MGDAKRCPECDDDGYVDVVDEWGGVVGPAPCPRGCGQGVRDVVRSIPGPIAPDDLEQIVGRALESFGR